MSSCRNCNASLEESYRFCPMCMTPQTEEASKRLAAYVEQRAERAGGDGGGDLRTRLSYAVGFVAVVAGVATLADVGGVFFVLAGLFVLPPVRRLLEDRLGRAIDDRPAAAATATMVAAGVVVLVVG